MLTYLSIQNYALIESLQVSFRQGLNVLTGETGAGKSVIIGALKLILGERAESGCFRDAAKPLIVEGSFSFEPSEGIAAQLKDQTGLELDSDEDLILRREIQPEGKSRAFINGRLIPLSQLRDIGKFLVDLHGQHEHQLLFDESEHLGFLDDYSGTVSLLPEYQKIFTAYQTVKAERDLFRSNESAKTRELDLLRYQISELENAKLEEGEEDQLEREKILLANAEKIFAIVQGACDLLSDEDHAATQQLTEAARRLRELNRFDEAAASFTEDLEKAAVLAEETARELRHYREKLSFDPDRLSVVQERLSLIALLQKKYGNTSREMLQFLDNCRRRRDLLDGNEENLEACEKQICQLENKLKKMSDVLHLKRQEAAGKMTKAVCHELADLGMKDARLEIRIETVDFHGRGSDRVRLLLTANRGEALKPLREIASGGEAARIMLAFKKILASVDRVGCLIFDEIDANIGGRLGKVVGEKMKQIASKRQVLVITHLPQIASFADAHFKVVKQQAGKRVLTVCTELDKQERVDEIAAMMAGDEITRVSRQHAEEMMRSVTG